MRKSCESFLTRRSRNRNIWFREGPQAFRHPARKHHNLGVVVQQLLHVCGLMPGMCCACLTICLCEHLGQVPHPTSAPRAIVGIIVVCRDPARILLGGQARAVIVSEDVTPRPAATAIDARIIQRMGRSNISVR
jgi:hypothetical protein